MFIVRGYCPKFIVRRKCRKDNFIVNIIRGFIVLGVVVRVCSSKCPGCRPSCSSSCPGRCLEEVFRGVVRVAKVVDFH